MVPDTFGDEGGGGGEGSGSRAVVGDKGEVPAGDPGTRGDVLAEAEACSTDQPAGADACGPIGEVVDWRSDCPQIRGGRGWDDRAEENAPRCAAVVVRGIEEHSFLGADAADDCGCLSQASAFSGAQA